MPDRYANGDTVERPRRPDRAARCDRLRPAETGYFHGGDFKGLTALHDPRRLQRIKDLGFTALWVTPRAAAGPGRRTTAPPTTATGGSTSRRSTRTSAPTRTSTAFVDCAHGLGLKVYLDVVVNHTADVVQLDRLDYIGRAVPRLPRQEVQPGALRDGEKFPCLRRANMPRVPFVLAGDRTREEAGLAERPAQLPRPRQHRFRLVQPARASSRATSSGSTTCSPRSRTSMNGLAQIYGTGSRASRSTASGSTRRSTSTRRSSGSGCRRSARRRSAAGVTDFQIFGEVTLNDAVDLSAFVRDRGLPSVLDFPFQEVAAGYAAGARARGRREPARRRRLLPRRRTASTPTSATFLGNHDMGRAAQQILSRRPDWPATRCSSTSCSATTCCISCAARRSSTTATRSG